MTGELFLSHSTKKLTQMTALIDACVRELDSDQIWYRCGEAQNSIGNLILHLCGNVRQWIGWSIGGLPDIRERDLEFAASSIIEIPELLAKLNGTVGEAISILESFPPERLTERVATQDGERAALEVIYQVVGHFQQHAGQIIFAAKFYKKSS